MAKRGIIMDVYEQKYSKELRRLSHTNVRDLLTSPWFWIIPLLVIDIVVFFLGLFQFGNLPDWLIYGSGFLIIPLSLAGFFLFVSDRRAIRRESQLVDGLLKDGINAQALWDLGEKYNLPYARERAVSLRCAEGGLENVPHWVAADGGLPALEEIRSYGKQIEK